jgi:hypothetical protein
MEKQALEIELAWELLEIFNDKPIIDGLRGLVRPAIDEMESLRRGGGPEKSAFETAWKKEGGLYDVTKEKGGWDGIVKGGVDTLLAQHCAELIRLYGEVVETAAKAGIEKYRALDAKRKSYQKGDPSHWSRAAGGGRQREFSEEQTRKMVHGPVTKEVYDRHAHYAAQQGYVWTFSQSMGGGIFVWDLKDASTIYKLDKVFGLMAAADISGTTTDNLFFINQFKQGNLDPMFLLLPAATIVAGAHHSMLEVATALTLNDVCNYSVGLYTTMFPVKSTVDDAGAKRLKLALHMAEHDPRNRLMLNYYDANGRVAGCFLYDHSESREFALISRADAEMLDIARQLNAWPTKAEVDANLNKRRRRLPPRKN